MMKNRRVIWSLSVIAVLVLYLFISGISRKSADIPALKAWDGTDEILIKNNDKEIKIYFKDGSWFVGDGFVADKNKAESLDKGMKELKITDFISRDYFQKYDLTPEKAVRVTVKKEGEIKRDILIGKASTTSGNTYIKLADSDNIYLARGNLRNDYGIDTDAVRDKKIISLDRGLIERMEIAYQGKLTFEKKVEVIPARKAEDKEKDATKEKKEDTVEKWICREAGNIEVDRQKIDSFLIALSAVNADSFPALNKKDINGLICLVKAKMPEKEIDLKIHKKDGENYICTSSESPYVFRLGEWNTKKFFKTLPDFKK